MKFLASSVEKIINLMLDREQNRTQTKIILKYLSKNIRSFKIGGGSLVASVVAQRAGV